MAEGAGTVETQGVIWSALDRALEDAETASSKLKLNGAGSWSSHTTLQAKLLLALGNPQAGYWQLRPEDQGALVLRTMKLVPRVGESPQPQATLEDLFKLWRHPDPATEIARAVKVVGAPVQRPLLPEEELYLRVGGWLGDWLQWCRHSDVPLGYYLWAGLSALGAACRYNFFIDRGAENLRLNTYMIFVGVKATGKSSALSAEVDLLSRLNYQVNRWRPGTHFSPDVFFREHPWKVRLLPEDTNQETLTALLGSKTLDLETPDNVAEPADCPRKVLQDSTGLLALDELSTFLGREGWMIMKRIPWLTTMYGREYYKYQTKSGGLIELRNIALSMLGCCTPDWMREAITPLMFGGGFLDRTMVISRDPLGERSYPTAAPRDPILGNELARFLLPVSCRFKPEELYGDSAAQDYFEAWYREQPEPEGEHATSVKRMANHMWKVGGLLALSDDSAPKIRLEHMELAWQLLSGEESHYARFIRYLNKPPEQYQLELIERKLYLAGAYGTDDQGEPRYMMREDLYHHLRSCKGLTPPGTKASPFIDTLERSGRIESLVKGRGKAWRLTDKALADRDT